MKQKTVMKVKDFNDDNGFMIKPNSTSYLDKEFYDKF